MKAIVGCWANLTVRRATLEFLSNRCPCCLEQNTSRLVPHRSDSDQSLRSQKEPTASKDKATHRQNTMLVFWQSRRLASISCSESNIAYSTLSTSLQRVQRCLERVKSRAGLLRPCYFLTQRVARVMCMVLPGSGKSITLRFRSPQAVPAWTFNDAGCMAIFLLDFRGTATVSFCGPPGACTSIV